MVKVITAALVRSGHYEYAKIAASPFSNYTSLLY
jgi:hypothetical protein